MALGFVLMAAVSMAIFLAAGDRQVDPLVVQSVAGLVVFGGLTWVIGRRILRLTPAELGWVPAREGGPGFLKGFSLALCLGLAAQAAGLAADSAWRLDGGDFSAYLVRLVVLCAMLLPAALLEELAFRGAAIAGLARGVGRIGAVVVTAILFSVAHRGNNDVTAIGFANIGLAGIFLGLTFFTRGGLWTATGAHLGWNLALAGLAAPVSGNSFDIPWIDFEPGTPAWLTGGPFGPEGGLLATGALLVGVIAASRWRALEKMQ